MPKVSLLLFCERIPTMKYKTTVRDTFLKIELNGEFEADTIEEAEKDCRDFYSHELDTTMEDVDIVSITPII